VLFLIGFMAAGKTSVGRALAQSSGRRFVDLDDVVATMGEPVAQLVARDEAEFRRREAAALAQVIADGYEIIATGGGAATFGDNLARMRAAGCVVALGVDVDTAVARAGGAGSGANARPLLAKAHELAAARAPVYRRAHAVVDTNGKSIDEVAREVAHVERVYTHHGGDAIVALGDRSYPIQITDGWAATSIIANATRTLVITDHNVARHHLASLEAPYVAAIEPGEASKSIVSYERLCAECIELGLDRGSAIVALGGGVVGDLAGFVAATLFRGIPVVQLPTTIVAMTDAAIGGKTAIDMPAGKNLVGAFHQPVLVQCNLATLATLPARERRAGFGELWKYALLDGPELWAAVDACAAWANAGGPAPAALRDVIVRAAAYKAAVVGRDERERTGQRALLNLGHTVGHAIEAHAGLHHGEAVGLGLVVACRVSAALGLAPAGLERTVAEALGRSGLAADPNPYLSDAVIERIKVDKKRLGTVLKFIAVREVGQCEPVEVDITELGRILRAYIAP
jgi:shikimate kinase/3-dehydroquinate synthase